MTYMHIMMRTDKEAIADDDPDMRNTFAKMTEDYSPASGKIFCSLTNSGNFWEIDST